MPKKAIVLAVLLLSLFSVTTLFAQVKIGTNPTTIDANSNLEVEASTTGRKVKVDKGTGQLTIKDGTEGNGKVLTSDADGGASWVPNAANSQSMRVLIVGYTSSNGLNQSTTQFSLGSTSFNSIAGSTINANTITLPPGKYRASLTITGRFNNSSSANAVYSWVAVNGAEYQRLGGFSSSGNNGGTYYGAAIIVLANTANISFFNAVQTEISQTFSVFTGSSSSVATIERLE